MRKIRFILTFVLVFMLFGFGCNKSENYYYRLIDNSISLKVGESIDISSLEINTNIPTVGHMYIGNIVNEEIINIDGLIITGIKEGEGEIKISLHFKDNVYICKLFVKVENNVTFQNDCELSYDLKTYNNENFTLYILHVFRDEEYFYNYTFEFLNYDAKSLISYNKYGYVVEIIYVINNPISIKIIDFETKQFIVANLP